MNECRCCGKDCDLLIDELCETCIRKTLKVQDGTYVKAFLEIIVEDS